MCRYNMLVLSCWTLLLATPALAWKPIVGPEFSATFTVKQTHPKLEAGGGEDSLEVGTAPVAVEAAAAASTHIADLQYDLYDRWGYNYADSDESSAAHASSSASAASRAAGFLGDDSCSLKKYAFNADGVAEYENPVPELSQFTICFWTRFTNHSGDHVILTYATDHNPRAVQFWVANANNSSFLSMAIKGQQVYRLNYPLRLRQWHHACSSWNGKTGEWQVWLKAERIGRGFHNALVGHKITAGGKLYSGGPSATAVVAQGLHFEVTLVQIYRIALSAGKAHRDHKHHHVHHFDHNGRELPTTTRPPPPINRPLPMQAMLANGQIPTRVRINLAQPNGLQQQYQLLQAAQQQQQQQQQLRQQPGQPQQGAQQQQQAFTIQSTFTNGQLNAGSRLVSQQVLGLRAAAGGGGGGAGSAAASTAGGNGQDSTGPQLFDTNPLFVDETETRFIFKRQAKELNGTKNASTAAPKTAAKTASTRTNSRRTAKSGDSSSSTNASTTPSATSTASATPTAAKKQKRHAIAAAASTSRPASNLQKRELVVLNDGSVVDDDALLGLGSGGIGNEADNNNNNEEDDFTYDGLAEFGGKQFKQDLNVKMNLADEVAEHDREPAEEEVKAVMALCGACDLEPFQGAIVFGWKDVREQLDNALKGRTVGHCGNF